MIICSFCGHRDVQLSDSILYKIELHLTEIIIQHGVTHFYCGFYGLFDRLCANIVRKIQCDYSYIKLCAITPYILDKYQERNQLLRQCSDELIYPNIEHSPYRYAISVRNDWIIKQSTYIVAFVDRSWGGASRCYKKAMALGKNCANFGSYSLPY